jgi:hypothetical protein
MTASTLSKWCNHLRLSFFCPPTSITLNWLPCGTRHITQKRRPPLDHSDLDIEALLDRPRRAHAYPQHIVVAWDVLLAADFFQLRNKGVSDGAARRH